jgi:DNA helicase-4
MSLYSKFRQKFHTTVEDIGFQAIQLVSVKKSYRERRDKNKLRELATVTKEFNLSEEQVNAATSHFKETLVVAGAGSGKTSVLIGRAKYLIDFNRAQGNGILMLAYNKDAAKELSERAEASGIEVTAQTFHAFGNSVIREPGARTGAAFGGDGEVASFLAKRLSHGLAEESRNDLARYFSRELVPVKDYDEFKNLNEYAAYVRATVPRTLMDEQVKSHGEWLIANYLYANGIDYEYEPIYNSTGNAKEKHKPDFLIRQRGKELVWVEYFGVDRNQTVAPGINQDVYNEGLRWKKSVHAGNKTNLVDLYYYDLKEGKLLANLETQIEKLGFTRKPRSTEEILTKANEVGYSSRFLKVCEQFLNHVRAQRLTQGELSTRAVGNPRDETFIKVFNQFLSAYELALIEKGLPDYAEQINGAADKIFSGEFPFNYTHVLVDEFQDISADRNRLLDAMKTANPELEVTCVGDDWQSIYRFGGSDISIMRDASKPRMNRKKVNLTNTYRLPQVIADVSREFILQNPLQLTKEVHSQSDLGVPGEVVLHWDTEQKEHLQNVTKVIERIGKDSENPEMSLKILSRYSNNLPDKKKVEQLWEGLVETSTIHAAKGLEADYVIITDLIQDFRGFPSTIEDDPVMRLVMPEKDLHEHSEERRLFYVGLTRARFATHIISPISAPSVFAAEMLEKNMGKHVGIDESKNKKCPVCRSGRILVSQNAKGSYCSNIPLCDFISPRCEKCENPMEMSGGPTLRFVCPKHPEVHFRSCPACSWGVMVPKINSMTGQEFESCHTWVKTRCKGYSVKPKPTYSGSKFAQVGSSTKPKPTYSGSKFAQVGEVGKLFAYGSYKDLIELDGTYALVDLETSGFSPSSAKILEIAILKIDAGGKVLDEFSTLINPESTYVGRTDIHGVTYKMVKNAPTFSEASHAILRLLENSIIVAHNAKFEENFLSSEFRHSGHKLPSIPAIDTLWLSRQILDLPNYKLDTVIRSYGEVIDDAHTALGDIRAMAKVIPRMLENSEQIFFPKAFGTLPKSDTEFKPKSR